MEFRVIEYYLVLIGWVVALLLGFILLLIKPPKAHGIIYYRRGKDTCAVFLLVLGLDFLFQWLIRFRFSLNDPALSVSVHLFSFCLAMMVLITGFCVMLAPAFLDGKQRRIIYSIVGGYGIFLFINYFIRDNRLQTIGILIACVALFVLSCISIYKGVNIYRSAITDLRTYYSDIAEDLVRWIPVGAGLMLFLLAAPIVCVSPRWVGVNHLAFGIIMFIYTFISMLNFSFNYDTMAAAIRRPDDVTESVDGQEDDAVEDKKKPGSTSLSASLQEIMRNKESRWREQGGYRVAGVTIEQAAHAMGTNRSYLSRYLNEVRNMTFYEWVARMRVGEAQSIMLQEADATIDQVASRVGFSSVSTFSSTFKKMVGESPVKWRNRQDL